MIQNIGRNEIPEELQTCFTCSRRSSAEKLKSYCETCVRNVNYHDSYNPDDMLIKLIANGHIK